MRFDITRAGKESKRAVVFHVLPQDRNRGAQIYAGKLRDALKDDSMQEHLVVTLFKGTGSGAHPDVALQVRSRWGRRLLSLRALWGLRALIRRHRPSLVIAHGGEALKYVILAAGGVPTVYYKVGLSSLEIRRPIHKFLYRWLSRHASLVVGNSSAIVRQVSDIFAIPVSQQVVIPNGRDAKVYRPLREGESSASPPRILFVGQLEPGKRPDLFLDSVDLLRQKGLHFDAAIAGEGPMRTGLESRAQQLGVKMLGVRNDIPELMRTSAVVMMTSAPQTEGMPGVLIEAGMSGLPVVATNAAGVKDVVDDGVTGWVTEESDAQSLADRAAVLLSNPSLRATYGKAARRRCQRLFSIEETAVLWRNLTRDIIQTS